LKHTVDGRNPVDMVYIALFTWFYTSQVVQDFFHQQYQSKWESSPILGGEKNELFESTTYKYRF